MSAERRIIVHRVNRETPMRSWIPLHMTMLHWFESSAPREEMAEQLREFASKQQPVETWATVADMFGEGKDVPVMRMELSTDLLELHLGLLALAEEFRAQLDHRWVGAGKWNPHVSHQHGERLFPGDNVLVDDLDFIAARPDGTRELIDRVSLSGATIKR